MRNESAMFGCKTPIDLFHFHCFSAYFIPVKFIDGKSEELNTILDNYVIYIMPVLNVDGYHYTWTEVRNQEIAACMCSRVHIVTIIIKTFKLNGDT